MEENSVLVQASYEHNKNDQDFDATQRHIESYGLKGYHIDKDLSDDESLVLFNDQDDEITLAIRGTEGLDPEDWMANFQIISGNYITTERYEGEEAKIHKIMGKYPNKKMKVAGHSLGGNISYRLGRKYNIEGHHFNPAAFTTEHIDAIKSLFTREEALDKQNFYTTGSDWLSTFQDYEFMNWLGKQKVHYQYKPGVDWIGHSIKHFLPPKNGEVEETYKSYVERFKARERNGFLQMTLRPRVQGTPLPPPRSYCEDNPRDPRCRTKRIMSAREQSFLKPLGV